MIFTSNLFTSTLKKTSLIVVCAIYVAGSILSSPSVSSAQEVCNEDRLRNLGVRVVNCTGENQCLPGGGVCLCSPNGNGSFSGASGVFFIGDSITVQMTDNGDLLQQARDRGYAVDTNYESTEVRGWQNRLFPRRTGASVEAIGAYQSTNIQPHLAEHAEDYADVGTIVVGLGTNRSTDTDPETMIGYVTEFVEVLRSNNPGARIFWVNVYREDGRESQVNAAIAEAGVLNNINVLDFSSVARSDPTTYPLADPVHHTTTGNKNKAKWILDQISFSNSTSTNETSIADVSTLTEDQKIAQTFILGFNGAQRDAMKAAVEKYKIGGVFILGNDNGEYNKAFFDNLNESAGIPLLVASDEEGGRVQRFRDQIGVYPSAKELGQKTDAEVELIAKEIGDKLLARGVNTVLAPVADLSVEGSGAVFDLDRGFSEDPAIVKAKASAFAKGLRSAGVNPTYKHFPGLGTTPGNTDNEPQTSPDIDTLRGRDLLAFEGLVNNHNGMVMLNNAVVPGLTEEGEVVGTSAAGVRLLREELDFEGIITTDDLKAGALASEDSKDTVAKSLQAGVTMPLFNYTSDAELQGIIDEVKSRQIDVSQNLADIVAYKSSLPSSDNSCPSGKGLGDSNEQKVWNFFVDKIGPLHTAAAMGNFWQESRFDPTIVNSIGATGLAQWLGGRKDLLLTRPNPLTIETQYEFAYDEFLGQNGSQKQFIKIRGQPLSGSYEEWLEIDNLADATIFFRRAYERPGEAEANDLARINAAQGYLDRNGAPAE